MATYEEIYGKRVKEFDSDPTLDEAYEGQVWYNTSDGVLKTLVKSAVVSSASNMPTATRAFGSIGNTSEAYIAAAGANPGTNYATAAYEYDGSSWSGIPAVTYSRDNVPRGSLGTTSAGIIFGGLAPSIRANTELWNGSSWSESGDLSDSRGASQSFGTQTACVTTGGYNEYSPPYWTNATEEFDGSSWTSGTATPLNTINGCGVGTSTAGIIIGQQEQPSNSYPGKASVTQTRNYDGSAWTNGGVINMATPVASVAGTSSSCRKAGGSSPAPASYTNQEEWDGSSWTTGGALVTDLSNGGGAGTAVSAVFSGGQTSSNLATTQEVVKQAFVTTAAAFASGGALTAGARRGLGSGKNSQTLTAGLVFGGGGSPYSGLGDKTEEYDGTSFTAGGDLNTYRYNLGGAGSQTAGLGFGGYLYPPAQSSNATEEYDGSSWTSVNNMSDARQSMSSFGTQTAAIAAAGYSKPTTSNLGTTLSYDGTNWTALSSPANVTTTRSGLAGSGTQTAGLATGGNTSPHKQTEEWDGSAWTNQNVTNTEHKNVGNQQLGIQTNALICSGGPPNTTSSEAYDGTSWSTSANMATARYEAGAGGSGSSGFVAGGFTSTNVTNTEEFTAAFTTFPASTLTTS
jgi:hypothetical protein